MADIDSITAGQTDLATSDPQHFLESVLSCAPLITPELTEYIEGWFLQPQTGVVRRSGLALAMQRGEFFKRLSEDRDMAQAVADTLGNLDGLIQILKQLLHILETALARAMAAVCKHDGFDPGAFEFAAR